MCEIISLDQMIYIFDNCSPLTTNIPWYSVSVKLQKVLFMYCIILIEGLIPWIQIENDCPRMY